MFGSLANYFSPKVRGGSKFFFFKGGGGCFFFYSIKISQITIKNLFCHCFSKFSFPMAYSFRSMLFFVVSGVIKVSHSQIFLLTSGSN